MKRIVSTFVCLAFLLSGLAEAARRRKPKGAFVATAFTRRGITSSGGQTHRGVVAADTRVLPMGSTIRVRNAGRFSGTYTVADTGYGIRGRHIDIFMPDRRSARAFGKRVVEVEVLRWGEE